jgi:hypothetical protein
MQSRIVGIHFPEMTLQLILRQEAEYDIQEAYQWYEEQRGGLGEDFLLCLEAALSKIRHAPEAYPIVYKNVRRILIAAFRRVYSTLWSRNASLYWRCFMGGGILAAGKAVPNHYEASV